MDVPRGVVASSLRLPVLFHPRHPPTCMRLLLLRPLSLRVPAPHLGLQHGCLLPRDSSLTSSGLVASVSCSCRCMGAHTHTTNAHVDEPHIHTQTHNAQVYTGVPDNHTQVKMQAQGGVEGGMQCPPMAQGRHPEYVLSQQAWCVHIYHQPGQAQHRDRHGRVVGGPDLGAASVVWQDITSCLPRLCRLLHAEPVGTSTASRPGWEQPAGSCGGAEST